MEYTGNVGPDGYDRVVRRRFGEPGQEIFFWLKDGRVLAGMNVNVWDVAEEIERLVQAGDQVDEARLADPRVPLDAVAASPAGQQRREGRIGVV